MAYLGFQQGEGKVIGVQRVGCGSRRWAPSPEKILFVPEMMSECILMQFLTGVELGQSLSLETRILRFNRERAYKSSAKIIQKLTVKPKGGRTIAF